MIITVKSSFISGKMHAVQIIASSRKQVMIFLCILLILIDLKSLTYTVFIFKLMLKINYHHTSFLDFLHPVIEADAMRKSLRIGKLKIW